MNPLTDNPLTIDQFTLDNYTKVGASHSDFILILHITTRVLYGTPISIKELSGLMGYSSDILYQKARELVSKGLLITTGQNGKHLDYDPSPFYEAIAALKVEKKPVNGQMSFFETEPANNWVIDENKHVEHLAVAVGDVVFYEYKSSFHQGVVIKIHSATMDVSVPSLNAVKRPRIESLYIARGFTLIPLKKAEIAESKPSNTYKEVVDSLLKALDVSIGMVEADLTGKLGRDIFSTAGAIDGNFFQNHPDLKPSLVITEYTEWFIKTYGRGFRNVYEFTASWVNYTRQMERELTQ